ncbi:SGNH/GDSL hydrolase family protein [Kitasatospora sp. NPDC048365]|uniref:SGNH/GDSL hydrolase family protein n=1 Tax=Kitasatospora sp. NPDC048365 TaxID=3364050 RepID=UPI00370FD9FB
MTAYRRFVALGDSQTEGLGDGDETSGHRGWADRLAEQLAAGGAGFTYANLAVRGKRAAEIRAGQLAAALALRPDLASVMAGMNDLIRPGCEPDAVAGELEAMYAALTESGARVITFTFPDLTRIVPVAAPLRPRLLDFNTRIREAAARHGVLVVDTSGYEVSVDPRLWSGDRLHLAPLGHARIAAAAADALGLPGSDGNWREPLPPLPPAPVWRRAATELAWAGRFLGPWLGRRLTGRSSGDGRTAKRPLPLPVTPAG